MAFTFNVKRIFIRFRSFYFLFAIFFVLWMLFFDGNNIYEQYLSLQKVRDLEQEKEFYYKGIETLKKDIKELSTSPELFEKFAREKYMMKKPNEDVYILETE
jgi:cell division protein DivIC